MSKELEQKVFRIKAIRESLGISVQDFSKNIKVNENIYLDKEVPLDILHAISSKYNIEMTALITG
jgi:hypothetical protein